MRAQARLTVGGHAGLPIGVAPMQAQAARLVIFDCDGVTPPERLAAPGVTVFTDMRELPTLLGV